MTDPENKSLKGSGFCSLAEAPPTQPQCPGQSWRELLDENERLRALNASAIAQGGILVARIEAALAIPGKVREEMTHPLWPMLTEGDMLAKVEEMLVKALKSEDE